MTRHTNIVEHMKISTEIENTTLDFVQNFSRIDLLQVFNLGSICYFSPRGYLLTTCEAKVTSWREELQQGDTMQVGISLSESIQCIFVIFKKVFEVCVSEQFQWCMN